MGWGHRLVHGFVREVKAYSRVPSRSATVGITEAITIIHVFGVLACVFHIVTCYFWQSSYVNCGRFSYDIV